MGLRARSRLLFVWDAVTLVVVAFFMFMAAPSRAYAYVDPSVMTYAIQAIAGVAVALGTVLGVVFRRTRRRILAMLDIDENARKDLEAPVHRIDQYGAAVPLAVEARHAGPADEPPGHAPGEPGWRSRMLRTALVASFIVTTLAVTAPLEIVAGSAGSLVASTGDVVVPVFVTAGIMLVALVAVCTPVRGRAFGYVLVVLFALGLGMYLQAMVLNIGLPQADGGAIDWSSFRAVSVISAAVWVAAVASSILLNMRFPGRTQAVACILSVALVAVQGVAVASLLLDGSPRASVNDVSTVSEDGREYALTEKGLNEVSTKGNIIVFVLDSFDTADLESVLEDDPNALSEMTGFTWYPDSVGSMIPTRYGLPYLVNGQYPAYDEDFPTFLEERYARSGFLGYLDDAGYSVGLYTDTLGTQYLPVDEAREQVYDHTVNIVEKQEGFIDPLGAATMLLRCAAYRDLPWVLKPLFWFDTDQVNRAMVAERGDPGGNTPYLMDDAAYHHGLIEDGLHIDDEGRSGTFRLIHLSGAHYPYTIDGRGEEVGMGNTTRSAQAHGSLVIVSEYLRQLKELGVYDEATIIVTADHGDWYLTDEPLSKPASPIMLYKPVETSSAAAAPVVVSGLAVSATDVPPTVIAAAGGSPTSFGSGTPISQLTDEPRSRWYLATLSDGQHDTTIVEYRIDGDVHDMDNWHLSGRSWEANPGE